MVSLTETIWPTRQALGPQVAKMVGPKKEALAIAEGQLKEAEDKLSVKKATSSVFHGFSRSGQPTGLL